VAVLAQAQLDDVRGRLETWLRCTLGTEDVEVQDLEIPPGGNSNETAFCRIRRTDAGSISDEEVVLRLQPQGEGLYPRTDVLQQRRTLAMLLERSDVPVPAVHWPPGDAATFGVPFFLMDRVDGRVLLDVPSYHAAGWATELSADQRARMHDHAIGALVALHQIEVDDGPGFLERPGPGTPLRRHVAWVQGWHGWAARGRDLGVLDAGMRYVLEHEPDDDRTGFVWNDARVGNMIFADDLSIAAVIDVEVAGLGPGEIDLGWWLMFEEFLTEAQGVPRLDGVPDRAGVIARYETLSRRSVADLAWYEALATLSFAIIMLRYADREVALGRLDPASTMGVANPVAQMLARKVGLPVPQLAPEFAAVAAATTSSDR
jgi:aminoglycoside phosphotransferase (APT) family kinase protein